MTGPAEVITLRAATSADAQMILWLEEVAMKDYATALWGSWRPSDTAATLDVTIHEMVEVDGDVMGCIATRTDTDALRLLRLYLAPDARNKGVGSNVLMQIIGRASTGIPIHLRVLSNNPAVRFYRRHGFRTERETPEHVYMVYDGHVRSQKGELR
ncbi:MAG: GNAT family N-acetyltransferase [Pseudomonadota bacterium]